MTMMPLLELRFIRKLTPSVRCRPRCSLLRKFMTMRASLACCPPSIPTRSSQLLMRLISEAASSGGMSTTVENRRKSAGVTHAACCRIPSPSSKSSPCFDCLITLLSDSISAYVHRGLLLGTGPLVDPGFGGKLLIPLHNLTSSEYNIDTTEALIWIEFTKTTYGFVPFVPGVGGPTSPMREPMASQDRHFAPFPARKKFKTPDYYLRKANAGNPIRSSIPDALEQGRRDVALSAASAAGAAATARSICNVLFGIGFVTFAVLAVALYGVYYQVAGLVQNSIGLSTSVEQGLAPMAFDSRVAAEKLTAAQTQLDKLGQQVGQLKQEIEALKQRVPPPRTDQKSQH